MNGYYLIWLNALVKKQVLIFIFIFTKLKCKCIILIMNSIQHVIALILLPLSCPILCL